MAKKAYKGILIDSLQKIILHYLTYHILSISKLWQQHCTHIQSINERYVREFRDVPEFKGPPNLIFLTLNRYLLVYFDSDNFKRMLSAKCLIKERIIKLHSLCFCMSVSYLCFLLFVLFVLYF